MWNDEDNNPYGAFDRRDPDLSDSLPQPPVSPRKFYFLPVPLVSSSRPKPLQAAGYERSSSPASSHSSSHDPPEFVSHPADLSNSDDDEESGGAYAGNQPTQSYPRRGGVYDSRIEQILHEHPELPILITDAGKNHEGGGSYIVYTIRTGVCSGQSGDMIWPYTNQTTRRISKCAVGTRNSAPCAQPS